MSQLDSLAIDLSKHNTSYWYESDAAVVFEEHSSCQWGLFTVDFSLHAKNFSIDSLIIYQQASLTSSEHTIVTDRFNVVLNQEGASAQTTSSALDTYLVIEYRDVISYYFFIQLVYEEVSLPDFTLKSMESTEGVLVDTDSSLTIYRYRELFSPASPPMQTTYQVSLGLKIDSVFSIEGGLLATSSDFFYLIQSDTNSSAARVYYQGTNDFPKFATVDKLTESLQYISRDSESAKMFQSKDRKKALDDFWLSLYPLKRNAAEAIKLYFTNVTRANQYFTNYKPGWKTDPGMILIVFGTPMAVYREDWREVWRYDAGLEFEFRIISNLFAYQHYVLIRREAYASDWLSAVRTIRNNR
ncbi:MAG: GWxTD domain-containing protein [Cyclobacteriaceae bacterium]|jgi:GWxTD domain-containing protein